MEAREHAEALVKYFKGIEQEDGGEVWAKGAKTAAEWLVLIESDDITQAELTTFLGIVRANSYRSSGWYDLALGAYHWATLQGMVIPSNGEFFRSKTLPFDGTTSVEQAQWVLKEFERNSHDDPTYELWLNGISMAREWLRLISAEEVRRDQVITLLEIIQSNKIKYGSMLFNYMAVGVYVWGKDLGYSDLPVP